jgi:hypothetical protein
MAATPGEPHAAGNPRPLAPSMKARRAILDEDATAPTRPSSARPFADHLRDTPPAELPAGVKAALYVAAALVGLVLIASLMRVMKPPARNPDAPPPQGAAPAARAPLA